MRGGGPRHRAEPSSTFCRGCTREVTDPWFRVLRIDRPFAVREDLRLDRLTARDDDPADVNRDRRPRS
jgi:hypothetical protein